MRTLPFLVSLAACTSTTETDTLFEPEPACVAVAGEPELDVRGADARVTLEATGFFRTEKLCDRWWLVTPEGHPFISSGINSFHPNGSTGGVTGVRPYQQTTQALYETEADWAEIAGTRLLSWNITTAGSWSRADLAAHHVAVAVNLSLADADWLEGDVADYWDPAWQGTVEQTITDKVLPLANDPAVLGWFLDNEISWGPDWRGSETLLQRSLSLSATSPGKAKAVDTLIEVYGTAEAVSTAISTPPSTREELIARTAGWQSLAGGSSTEADDATTAFLTSTAERYYSVTTAAIRAADPNHLILGNREVAPMTRIEVHDAAARHVDVISMNAYTFRDGITEAAMRMSGGLDPAEAFAELAEHHDLPLLVSEFGFRADDAGLPNSWPPIYPNLQTQQDRADAFETAALPWIESGRVVGMHWFQWVDQPHEGRFDGEDNNWGLVNHADEPYVVLTDRMTQVYDGWWDHLQVPTEPSQ